MIKIKCPDCEGSSVKNGFHGVNQRYKCKACSRRFQLDYKYKAYEKRTDELLVSLLKESGGVRSISRVLGIATKTVLSKMLKISSKVKQPYFSKLGCSFEMDELFVKIANGFKKNWLIHAIERESRQPIAFYVSNNVRKESLRIVLDKILLLKPKIIYTDGLQAYKSLIPKDIHKRFQYSTNRIERKNLTLRTDIKRLARKTICFSKKEIYLEAHLKIYFWG